MKKLLFFAIATIFSVSTLFSQEEGTFELGVGAGVNLSNVSNLANDQSADLKVGFNGNVSGEYYFSDRWGIKARLMFDQKGWKSNTAVSDAMGNFIGNRDVAFKTNYLTVPVMANWHFGSNRNWYLNFGPYFGFLLNAEEDFYNQDIKDSFESFDVGLNLGIGYKFNIAENTKMYIEYDGQSGFVDTAKNNTSGDTIRNVRSSFNVGVLFNL